jgi:magnesium-transporting ATPase (P-type)
MAGRGLNAIENLGSMDVLCTDKTGTLTEGLVQLEGAYDGRGQTSQEVLDLAALNAALETGIASPLDDAITNAHQPDLAQVRKLGFLSTSCGSESASSSSAPMPSASSPKAPFIKYSTCVRNWQMARA